MKESIHNYLQVGLIHFMAYPTTMKGEGPIAETLKKIAVDDYFDAIEITQIADDDVRAEAKRILTQSHLNIYYGAQPRLLTTGLNPNDLNEEGRRAAEKTLLEAIDEAEYLGAKKVAFLSGNYDSNKKDDAYHQLLKTTKNLCAYANTKGMDIVLEVFDYDLDKKALIGPAPLAAKFAAEMRESVNNFGLMVDLSHIPQTYETTKFVIQTLRPYIVHFHIGNCVVEKDAEAFGDTHPRFGFHSGVNDVKEVVEFLKVMKEENFFDSENPYPLSFEVKPWGDEDPAIVVANAKRVLNRAWALV